MKMIRFNKKASEKGIILISVFMVIVILVIFGIAIFMNGLNDWNLARRQKDRLKAQFMARAGLAKVTYDIYDAFRNDPNGWNPSIGLNSFNWFTNTLPGRADLFPNRTMFNELFPGERPEAGMFTVILPQTQRADETSPGVKLTANGADVRLIAIGEVPATYLGGTGTVKAIIALTVSYELGPSPVFNYAYFVNNFGWLWGGGITTNGDVRSNGNFSFNGSPEINGDIYASVNPALGATGDITGNSKNVTLSQYASQAPERARPSNPTDPSNPDTAYEGGYNGSSQRFPNQSVLNMPYLGDLQNYRDLAQLKDGTITQVDSGTGQTVTLVDNVYSGNGPDATAGTGDDGSLILVGTATNPIMINGPVVVNSDVIIKGVVQGQGTIYAGRNIHVVGDVTYKNGPGWTKPDSDPQATAQTNKTKDFLGLACKGNIIVGDYTRSDWITNVRPYLRPPFTQGYEIDPSDASIGYDTNPDPTNYFFNGDYTAYDGGKKADNTNRRFYESSVSDNTIRSVAVSSSQIRQVDAVTYNNHAFSGKVGAFSINGCLVCRDEAIIYSGSIKLNYDMRAYGNGMEYLDIYLPRDLTLPKNKLFTKLKETEG